MKFIIEPAFQVFLKEQNINLKEILEEANLPNLLWQEEMILEAEQFCSFEAVLDKYISDEQLLLLSDVSKISLFMPLIFVALSSQNGFNALRTLAKYKQTILPMKIEIKEENDQVKISIKGESADEKLARFTLFYEQLVIINILRTGTGKRIIPEMIGSPYPESPVLAEWTGISSQVTTEENWLIFKSSDLELPFLTKNNSMRLLLEPELNRQLTEIETNSEFVNVVRKELQILIPANDCEIGQVAKNLGLSTRSLQRKLQASKTTFKSELQLVRKEMAIHFSKNPNLSTDEISYLLGYSEVSSFSRAFKTWTGMTLKRFRKQND